MEESILAVHVGNMGANEILRILTLELHHNPFWFIHKLLSHTKTPVLKSLDPLEPSLQINTHSRADRNLQARLRAELFSVHY